uniref:F-box domain-containing protein n=1 Tax=Kalanchoe fedtschenkoi TaxID=63787 RepID=A0A7N0VBP5_KALFE
MLPTTETWSLLPSELLVTIADHLSNPLDFLRLRSTCSSWRNSVSRHRPGECSVWSVRIPFPIIPLVDPIEGLYTFTKSSVCFIRPGGTEGWLVKIEEFGLGRLRALDPVSTVRLGGFPKVLNLVELRVLEIARSFSFNILDVEKTYLRIHETRSVIPKKVAVASVDGNVGGLEIRSWGFFMGATCCIWDGKWNDEPVFHRYAGYSDVVFWKERFYIWGGLVIFDRDLNKVTMYPFAISPRNTWEQKYLVVASDSLYLVVNSGAGNEDFEVGRVFDEDEVPRVWLEVFCFIERNWVQVYSLGELAFFIADDCSFSVVARDCPPYKRNCIYYSDYDVGDSTLQTSCHVFDLEENYFQT